MSTYEKYGLKALGHDAAFTQLNQQQIRAEIEQERRAERREKIWRNIKGVVGFLAFVGGLWFIANGMHLALNHHDSEMMTTILFVVFIIGAWFGYQVGRQASARASS
jgi:hypothetical protein